MENEEKKIAIKLERHQWPDEIEQSRKKRRVVILIVSAIVVSFVLGLMVAPRGGGILVGTNPDISRFESIYNELLSNWYFSQDMENPNSELIDNAIFGMLEKNGDVHTNYMTAEEALSLSESIDMEFVGIGVQFMGGQGMNLVTRVYKDSPAEKSGVLSGDIISKVDGVSVADMSSDEIKEIIVGDAGTDVSIDFIRDQKVVPITITRSAVSATVWGEILNDDIAYLEMSSFGRQLAQTTQLYLDDFLNKGAKKLIIDLRDNGGGYLQTINELSKLFFENNDVVYTEDFKNQPQTVFNVTESVKEKYQFDEVVLLLNQNSASASEVLAIAMRENNGTKIVGVNSYGKGTVQTQRLFGDGSTLKITIAKWNSPHGNNINEVGIKPDVEVKLHDIFYTEHVVLEDGQERAYDTVDPAVAYVQVALNFLGYHNGRTDGYFDQVTLNSLRAFNKAIGFEGGDTINQTTIQSVYSSVLREWAQNKKVYDTQLNKAIEVLKGGL